MCTVSMVSHGTGEYGVKRRIQERASPSHYRHYFSNRIRSPGKKAGRMRRVVNVRAQVNATARGPLWGPTARSKSHRRWPRFSPLRSFSLSFLSFLAFVYCRCARQSSLSPPLKLESEPSGSLEVGGGTFRFPSCFSSKCRVFPASSSGNRRRLNN